MTQGISRWAKEVKTKEKEKSESSVKEAKQVCGFIAKMVREFWKNVDKIADYRAQVQFLFLKQFFIRFLRKLSNLKREKLSINI